MPTPPTVAPSTPAATPTTPAAPTGPVFFEASIAHPFVMGIAFFSIFWGVTNALLIRSVNMSDSTVIEKVLKADKHSDAENQPLKGESPSASQA